MNAHDPHRRPPGGEDPTRQAPAYRHEEHHYYDDAPDPYDPRDPYVDPAPEYIRRRQDIVYRKIANVVWLITFIIISIILLRVILLLINANEANSFVSWVYNTSKFFVRPFFGITDDPAFNGAVFEINSLIAMLIYILVIFGILQLVRVILDLTSPTEP